jgi:hypothetical protein
VGDYDTGTIKQIAKSREERVKEEKKTESGSAIGE